MINSELYHSIMEWIMIIDTIIKYRPNIIEIRETDHEYRTDTRDIVRFKGKLVRKSVDGLPYNIEQDAELIKDLLECYNDIMYSPEKNM